MLISTTNAAIGEHYKSVFQSLDWVDVDFDRFVKPVVQTEGTRFNPSTGLMLISTTLVYGGKIEITFQSLDWVDVDFD